jgi:hypothetical protein
LVRQVRGILFLDYVRMLRSQKRVADWTSHGMLPEDLVFLNTRIDADSWYPMTTFERMGNAILATVARGEMFPVRMWGRYSASQLVTAHPMLLAKDDPPETLARFRVLRDTYFDFPALDIPLLHLDEANITIRYHMGMPAEEAASHQTMGFFEGLLELCGVRDIDAVFREKSWAGDPRTLMVLRWVPAVRGN